MTHLASHSLFEIPFAILCIAIVLCSIRLLIGPSIPDRVVALDLLAVLLIATISVFCILVGQPIYIDVVIALALVIFLGTVAFAQLLGWRKPKS